MFLPLSDGTNPLRTVRTAKKKHTLSDNIFKKHILNDYVCTLW